MEIREAIESIQEMEGIYLLSIVNAEGTEVPVEFVLGKDKAREEVERLLAQERDIPEHLEPNVRIRARNQHGNVCFSRRIQQEEDDPMNDYNYKGSRWHY